MYNNNNPQEFRVALEMLNWNVMHLCISQGVSVDVEKYERPLLNLLEVLRSPCLGRLVTLVRTQCHQHIVKDHIKKRSNPTQGKRVGKGQFLSLPCQCQVSQVG